MAVEALAVVEAYGRPRQVQILPRKAQDVRLRDALKLLQRHNEIERQQ